MRIEDIASQEAHNLPGFELIHCSEVAFPVWRVNLKVQVLKESLISVVDEFVLKLIDAGVGKLDDILDVLGIDKSILTESTVLLLRNEIIKFDHSTQSLLITKKGKPLLDTLKLRHPETTSLNFCIDGITGHYCAIEGHLLIPKAVKKYDYHSIHPIIDQPSEETVDFKGLDNFLKDMNNKGYGKVPSGQLIEILSIERVWAMFKLLRVLTYVDKTNGDYRFVVYDRNHKANEYDQILTALDKEKNLGIIRLENIIEPDIDSGSNVTERFINPLISLAENNLNKLNSTEKELQQITNAVNLDTLSKNSREELIKKINKLQNQIESYKKDTRLLRTFEHRPLLENSFDVAKNWVIIVSPWLAPDAFDDDLLSRAEKALQKGVKIIILYGYPGELNENKAAKEKIVLTKINAIKSKQFGKNLLVNNIKVTHEKILICDRSYIIVGSFNWLSFRGEKLRGLRLEKSIYTEDKGVIDDAIKDMENYINLDSNKKFIDYSFK